MNQNEIAVFICEDDAVAREIIGKYLKTGHVTFAEFLPKDTRPQIIKALDDLVA